MNDNNYFVVNGWMINCLGLKSSNEVNVFAVIYGFTQDGKNKFTGSLKYLSELTMNSKPTVIRILKKLCELELIVKTEVEVCGVVFNHYCINTDTLNNLLVVKKLNEGSKETLLGVVKKLNGGSKETLPNNKEDIYKEDIYNNNKRAPKKYDINLDGFTEQELVAIEQFKQHRNHIKKSMSELSYKIFVNKCLKFKELKLDIVALIYHSVLNGYSDIYEPKPNFYKPSATQSTNGVTKKNGLIDNDWSKIDPDAEVVF